MGLALVMVLRFYTSAAKRFKLKFRKFWGLISTFVEVTEEKILGGLFDPSWIGLMTTNWTILLRSSPKFSLQQYFEMLMDGCYKNSEIVLSRKPMDGPGWIKRRS